MSKKHTFTTLTMGSAALIVSGAAMAAAPTSPVTSLSAHSALNYAISQTAGIANPGNYDTNGDLLTGGLTCGNGGTITCTEMDGTGDGMIQYKVTDNSNTASPKSHVELVVGQMYDGGLFLSDTFVRYNGGVSLNSMASKLVIKDQTELAAADTGFRVDAEWLRGDYQTFQPEAFNNALANAPVTRMDSIVDMNIGGVETFHAEGQVGENGDFSIGGLVDIQANTTAANTAAGAPVFHMRSQGGTSATAGAIDYQPGANTISLGGQTLAFGANDGVSATYIRQAMPGFNSTDNYTSGNPVDDPTLRDFAYVKFTQFSAGGGFPPINIGQPNDPMNGIPVQVASLTTTSQSGAVAVLGGAVTAANNAIHAPDFNGVGAGAGLNDPGTQTNGTFLSSEVTNIQSAWSTIFGSAPQ
jgi:hypothetical protein